jgi:hypothetical protein
MKRTKRPGRWRLWQFHIRTLLILMTITAISSSIYAWRLRREEHRQQYLGQQVEKFNAAMEDQKYLEAEIIAIRAAEAHPNEPVLEAMVEKSRFAFLLVNGARVSDGFVCGTWRGANDEGSETPSGDGGNLPCWED